jgi:hypothetical protein
MGRALDPPLGLGQSGGSPIEKATARFAARLAHSTHPCGLAAGTAEYSAQIAAACFEELCHRELILFLWEANAERALPLTLISLEPNQPELRHVAKLAVSVRLAGMVS